MSRQAIKDIRNFDSLEHNIDPELPLLSEKVAAIEQWDEDSGAAPQQLGLSELPVDHLEDVRPLDRHMQDLDNLISLNPHVGMNASELQNERRLARERRDSVTSAQSDTPVAVSKVPPTRKVDTSANLKIIDDNPAVYMPKFATGRVKQVSSNRLP